MASSHTLVGQENGSKPRRTVSAARKPQNYPPPAALPDYVNRALPPRPDSNTTNCESPDEAAKRDPISKPPLPIGQVKHENINPSPTGIVNEAGMALVHSQVVTSVPLPLSPQKKSLEIAAPQPIYPAPTILTTQSQDLNIVSPVSAPLSGNPMVIKHDQYEVSPLSPTSQHSFPRSPAISEEGSKRISSPTTGDLILSLSPSNTESNAGQKTLNRNFVYSGTHTAHSSGDLAAARLASPHSQVEQIGGRYSDPGSPISGAVIHPPTAFPLDPDLSVSRHVDLRDAVSLSPLTPYPTMTHTPAQSQTQTQTQPRDPENQIPIRPKSPSSIVFAEDSSVGASSSQHTSSGSGSGSGAGTGARVAFAGPGEGFKRARANSKRSAPPPPLKLSERPIADAYVKTPFPPAPAPAPASMLQRGLSNPTQRRGGDEDREGGLASGGVSVIKKLNRVSSLPGFGFTKSLRRSSTVAGTGMGIPEGLAMHREREREREREKEKEKQKEREGEKGKEKEKEKEGTSSPMPKVKNLLERARQMSIGHGLGIGIGSEEARKERRRAEIKRQIRVEPISRDGK
ncbi:hypothetical protein ABKA04_006798 [Annulohypoxylon sp. FPYF3050]